MNLLAGLKYLFEISLPLPYLNLKVFDSLYKLLILPFLLTPPDVSLCTALYVSEDALEARLLEGEVRLIEGLGMGLWDRLLIIDR